MSLRPFILTLFLLAQLASAVATPPGQTMADGATDMTLHSAAAETGDASDHCGNGIADEVSEQHSAAGHDEQCNDGCQLCAACALGLSSSAQMVVVVRQSIDAAAYNGSTRAGVVSQLLRPPLIS